MVTGEFRIIGKLRGIPGNFHTGFFTGGRKSIGEITGNGSPFVVGLNCYLAFVVNEA
jgi:hypothetical protein